MSEAAPLAPHGMKTPYIKVKEINIVYFFGGVVGLRRF